MSQTEQISIKLAFSADDAAIGQVQKRIEGLGTAAQNVSKTITGVGNSLAGAFGVGLSVGGIIGFVKQVVEDFAANIENMAGRLEISTDAFQHLSNMARQNGVDMTQLTQGLTKLRASIDSAAEGSPRLVQAFQTLGVDAKTLANANLDDALQAIAIQIVNATDKTAALNAANEILGTRSMPKLLEMIMQLGRGIHDTSEIIDKEYLERVRQASIATADWMNHLKGDAVIGFAQTMDKFNANFRGDVPAKIRTLQVELAQLQKETAAAEAHMNGQEWWNRLLMPFDERKIIHNREQIEALKKTIADLQAQQNATATPAGAAAPAKAAQSTPLLEAAKAEAARNFAAKQAEMAAEERAAATLRNIELQKEAISNDVSKTESQRHAERIALTGQEIAMEQAVLATITQRRDAEQLGSEQRKKIDREMETQAAKVAALQRDAANEQRQQRAAVDREQAAASLAEEIPMREKLADIEKDKSLITQNRLIDSVEKQRLLNINAEEYRQIVEKIIAIERERFGSAKDSAEVARLKAEIARLQSAAKEYGRRNDAPTRADQSAAEYQTLLRNDGSAHFQTAGSGLMAGLQQYAARIGTIGDQINAKFQSVAETITGSISSGLTAVIMHTESWHQALANIASTILGSIINAIVQMGVEWVTQQVMMAVVGKTIAASSLAANAGIAMAQSAIWAAPATLATIASFGGAALAAPVEIAGAMLETQGLALASEGGVFDGDPSEPRGIFHGGEGILTARTMSLPGMASVVHALNAGNRVAALSNLQASVMGRLAGGGRSVSAAKDASSGGGGMAVTFVDDRNSAINNLRRSNASRKQLVEIIRNDRGAFFM